MTNRVKVGIVGAGGISYTYLKNLTETFHITEVVGIADIIEERSKRRAEQFHIRQMTVEEIMNDPEIEIVVNLTYPLSHYIVSKQALESGKHVFAEKMMSTDFGTEQGAAHRPGSRYVPGRRAADCQKPD